MIKQQYLKLNSTSLKSIELLNFQYTMFNNREVSVETFASKRFYGALYVVHMSQDCKYWYDEFVGSAGWEGRKGISR
jgi:hypothetical protein